MSLSAYRFAMASMPRLAVSNTHWFNIAKKQVYEAYKAVKSKAGAAGVDRQTIEQFDSNLRTNLYKLWNRMSGLAKGDRGFAFAEAHAVWGFGQHVQLMPEDQDFSLQCRPAKSIAAPGSYHGTDTIGADIVRREPLACISAAPTAPRGRQR